MMCFKCTKVGHVKADYPFLNQEKSKKYSPYLQLGTDKSEREDGSDEGKKSLSYFITLSNKVTNLNSKSNNSFDQFDMPRYDKVSHVFSELHNK